MVANENRNSKSLPIAEALDQIYAFIGKYLVCSMHQRTVLALWVVHTYCYQRFPATPYLEISSPECQSGKTVCLGLLEVLCKNAWMPGGVTAACITTRLANNQPTLLLDDWRAVLRSSGNQPLMAMLKAGSRAGSYYPEYPKEKDWDGLVFCPKAFADQGHLPGSLATHCVPIVLRPKRSKDRVASFWQSKASFEVADLRKSLSAWAEENTELIRELASANLANPKISSFAGVRHHALLPLLTLAGAAGRKWVNKILLALHRIFSAERAHTSSAGLQLLSDIRNFFRQQNDPPKIHTAPLLEYLNGLEERPWKKLTPNTLRVILQDYPVHRSSKQRIGDQQRKGFTFQHFVASWESYLPHLPSRRSPRPVPAENQVVANKDGVVPNSLGVVPNGAGVVPNGPQVVPNNA